MTRLVRLLTLLVLATPAWVEAGPPRGSGPGQIVILVDEKFRDPLEVELDRPDRSGLRCGGADRALVVPLGGGRRRRLVLLRQPDSSDRASPLPLTGTVPVVPGSRPAQGADRARLADARGAAPGGGRRGRLVRAHRRCPTSRTSGWSRVGSPVP